MPSLETGDYTDIRDLVKRIDDLVPREGAIVQTRIDYGELEGRSCTHPSTVVVGNRLGYLRLGIAFLNAAYTDLSRSYPPLRVELDLRGIQGLKRICYEFERREEQVVLEERISETSSGGLWTAVPGLAFFLGVGVALLACTVIGAVAVLGWMTGLLL